MSNFDFAKTTLPSVHGDCARAESYVASDPRSAVFYSRRAVEERDDLAPTKIDGYQHFKNVPTIAGRTWVYLSNTNGYGDPTPADLVRSPAGGSLLANSLRARSPVSADLSARPQQESDDVGRSAR